MNAEKSTLATFTYPGKQQARVQKYKFSATSGRHAIGQPVVTYVTLSPTSIG